MFGEKGHGHGPNTNTANGLGNPTGSLIEAGSPMSSGWGAIRNSKREKEIGERPTSYSDLEKQRRGVV